jgi:beta-glucosidase
MRRRLCPRSRLRHFLRIEYSHHALLFGAGLSFDWKPPVEAERAEAVKAATQADVVVAFVGLSPELEGEEMPVHVEGFNGGDRTEIELPAVQREMLEAVAATGKPVVVVLMNGSALAVKWAKEHAAAVLEAWYPGEEGGTAIAYTLSGDNNPAGRLPMTTRWRSGLIGTSRELRYGGLDMDLAIRSSSGTM